MKLKVLVDNNTFIDMYYLGEPGVSYYIEDGDTKILFDTGYSDAFMQNAQKMNIDLNNIDKLVISHGHDDHTRGIKYLLKDKKDFELVAHPKCFGYKEDEEGQYIGSPVSLEYLRDNCNLKLSDTSVKISDNIYFLGEIPTYFDFEKRYAIGTTIENEEHIEDYLVDDSAIAYKSKDGIFVISGCSHSGICNIIEHAKKVCGDNRVLGVIGGFHLFENDDRLKATIKYFKKNKIKMLYPCHCVSLEAKIEMAKKMDIREVGVGLEIEI